MGLARAGVSAACADTGIAAEDGFRIWTTAIETAEIIPAAKAKRFRGALAELSGIEAVELPPPTKLREFLWSVLRPSPDLDDTVARPRQFLTEAAA